MQNKVVVITGSTSGIGLGIAKKFASHGAKLVINGFAHEEQVIEIIKELMMIGAGQVIYENADLSKPDEINHMFKNIIATYNTVDVLINNAGIQFVSPIEEFPPEKWEAIMRINLIASFYTIKNVVPLMKKNNWGRIINIASAHALVASPFKSAYVAAKHGVLGLTKTVALEVARNNITANAICPGYVKTPLVLGQIKDTAKARGMSEEEVVEKIILGSQATKKFVEIEELAGLAYFLCSNEAASITGTALPIDGGWTTQ
ncbi:MAG: 3-hydroxybutyrate dehydrogenase [Rickettsiales bacterium]|nr:MAG: 3-hydroxybutyrate dehydrogenase [Rickettsiales bacterium]